MTALSNASPSVPNPLHPPPLHPRSSLLVLMAGNGSVSVAGRSMQASILEIDPVTGATMQTLALPSEDTADGYACTIANPGTTGISESFMMISGASGRWLYRARRVARPADASGRASFVVHLE